MKKYQKKEELLKEIEHNISFKMFNVKNGTATKMERQIMFELLGFHNMIRFSKMPFKEIKEHLDRSNLLYM